MTRRADEEITLTFPPGWQAAADALQTALREGSLRVSISPIAAATPSGSEPALWIALWSRDGSEPTTALLDFARRGRLVLVLLDSRPDELPEALQTAPHVDFRGVGGAALLDAFVRSRAGALVSAVERLLRESGDADRAGSTVEGADQDVTVSRGGEQMAVSSLTVGDRIARELARLPTGRMLFNPPTQMRLGKRARIEARISRDLDLELRRGLKGLGDPQIQRLRVGTLMAVRLTGSAFDVEDLAEREQVVGPQAYTEWAWDVVPRKAGTQTLRLHVTVRLLLVDGGRTFSKDEPVLERDVEVQVSVGYVLKRLAGEHWRWLAAAVVIPVLIALAQIYLGG